MKHSIYIVIITFVALSCVNQTNKSATNTAAIEFVNDTIINESTNDSNNIVLSEFLVINEDFEYILDISIEEYNKCKNKQDGYHFTISIQNTKIEESLGIKSMYIASIEEPSDTKSVYISRSYYKGFVSIGYGFFYYKDYLFVLNGQQLEDVFIKTDKTQTFPYKDEPIVEFDPPRWLYCYWEQKFYFAYSSPCGG